VKSTVGGNQNTVVTPRRQTFQQFKTRDRGLSRRYSAAVHAAGGEYGALTHEGGELGTIYTKEVRNTKIRNYLIWGAINAGICSYVFFLLFLFRGSWSIHCVRKLNIWLLIYLIIQGCHLLRTIILIFIWRKAKDPSVSWIKLDMYFGLWVFLAEAALIIYGNTFIYDEEFKSCDE
jgi:hypothetical protein